MLAETVPGLSSDDMLAQSGPLAALALTDDVAMQCVIAAGWIALKTRPQPALAPPEGYRHRRLRVGYLSSDFCSHAMSYLIAELFERHDRSRFEIHGYCSVPTTAARSGRALSPRSIISRSLVRCRTSGRAAHPRRRDRYPDRPERPDIGRAGAGAALAACSGAGDLPRLHRSGAAAGAGLHPVRRFCHSAGHRRHVPAHPDGDLGIVSGQRQQARVGGPRDPGRGWTAGGSFRVLLLFQPLQDHREHVRGLDGDPAPNRRRRALAGR